ncbi:MAG: hypothetical protein JNN13_02475 [Planctomycetes bacterium]|nr:hypothetical protein [Planctomycetota bacterium]
MKPIVPVLLTFSAAFVACAAPPPYIALSIENDAEIASNVVVGDRALQDAVRVGRPSVDRVPGSNQLKVALPIRNIDDDALQLLVQVSFLDAQRAPIGDDTNRQVLLLGPGATQTHVAMSKFDAARDWVLRITWNR